MTLLTLPSAIPPLLEAADNSPGPADVVGVAGKIRAALKDPSVVTPEERRGALAELSALDFQRPSVHGDSPWEIYWGPQMGMVDNAGKMHYSPDVFTIDQDIIAHWIHRSETLKHPDLKGRYADLAWDIGRLLRDRTRKEPSLPAWTLDLPHTLAHRAIDESLKAAELYEDHDYEGWKLLDRALRLAISIGDKKRVSQAKEVLFRYRRKLTQRGDGFRWVDFDEITWEHSKALDLSTDEQREVIEHLEVALAKHSNRGDSERFDPHQALTAADRLQRRWVSTEDRPKAQLALRQAGEAFESIAKEADGMLATAWLEDLLPRYRSAGMVADAVRVEQAIRSRAEDLHREMKRIEVPIEIPRAELDEWADKVAGDTLEAGCEGIAFAALIREESAKKSVQKMVAEAPLMAHMPISITQAGGFTVARIGSIEDDLEGRAIHHAADLFSWYAPWLFHGINRLKEKHGLDAEKLLAFLARSPHFPAERELLLKEGLISWDAGDPIKAIHVLVPQLEAALRDLLAALGGSVMRYSPETGGFEAHGMGKILHDDVFRHFVPADLRFHLNAFYCDVRGINLRNRISHGLAQPAVLGMGVANWVIHSLILVSLLRINKAAPKPSDQGSDNGLASCSDSDRKSDASTDKVGKSVGGE